MLALLIDEFFTQVQDLVIFIFKDELRLNSFTVVFSLDLCFWCSLQGPLDRSLVLHCRLDAPSSVTLDRTIGCAVVHIPSLLLVANVIKLELFVGQLGRLIRGAPV